MATGSPPMTSDWQTYFSNVNDKLASILVDLGIGPHAPMAGKPWLLWLWVQMNAPRPDGLSDGAEAPKLYEIEDALIPALASAHGAVLAGRITTQNRREFYFYGEHADGFNATVAQVHAGFRQYAISANTQPDPEWKQYLDLLYPTPEQLQRIKNAAVLRSLERAGDIHTMPREVDHHLNFPLEAQRAAFREAALRVGFTVQQELETAVGEPFGIDVVRTQSVQQNEIDATVLELLAMATAHGGDYGGWGCVVTTAAEAG